MSHQGGGIANVVPLTGHLWFKQVLCHGRIFDDMTKVSIALLILAVVGTSFSQDEKVRFTLAPGQVSWFFGKSTSFLTFGGPGVSMAKTNFELSLRFLASLRLDLDESLGQPNESLRPLMGFGLQVRYKRVFITPAAVYFFQNKWEYAAGVGVQLVGKNERQLNLKPEK